MKTIVEGVRSFREERFKENEELFQVLAHGQSPRYLFITCADSRIVPNMITGLGPGDIFTMRNAGNIVPPPPRGRQEKRQPSSIAVDGAEGKAHHRLRPFSLRGDDIALIKPDRLEKLPAVADFLFYADPRDEPSRRAILDSRETTGHPGVKENVLLQLNHLRNTSAVASAMRRGDLQIHGWVYLIETVRFWRMIPRPGSSCRRGVATRRS